MASNFPRSLKQKPRRPEDQISDRVRHLMREQGWLTFKTHGSEFQAGLPDLLCWHKMFGHRMVEMKTKTGTLTPAQKSLFHLISAHGGMVWILSGELPLNDDALLLEIKKLQGPANWFMYL